MLFICFREYFVSKLSTVVRFCEDPVSWNKILLIPSLDSLADSPSLKVFICMIVSMLQFYTGFIHTIKIIILG